MSQYGTASATCQILRSVDNPLEDSIGEDDAGSQHLGVIAQPEPVQRVAVNHVHTIRLLADKDYLSVIEKSLVTKVALVKSIFFMSSLHNVSHQSRLSTEVFIEQILLLSYR